MSCIYHAECDECGKELTHKETMDSDGDITVYVGACEDCIEEAVNECRERYEEDGQ